VDFSEDIIKGDLKMTIEKRVIFTNRRVGKNASIITATPIPLGKREPTTLYWMDASLAGSGSVRVVGEICDTRDGSYYRPKNASIWVASMDTGRDRISLSLPGVEWLKPRAIMKNIATGTIDLSVIVCF